MKVVSSLCPLIIDTATRHTFGLKKLQPLQDAEGKMRFKIPIHGLDKKKYI